MRNRGAEIEFIYVDIPLWRAGMNSLFLLPGTGETCINKTIIYSQKMVIIEKYVSA